MNLVHWRHYLALEREFLEIAQYIEICQENFHVHSIKFSHLLMASASEFETVGGMIRDKSGIRGTGINSILETIDCIEGTFKETEIDIPLYQLKLKPLEECAQKTPPSWWTAYNKVKHHRTTHFNEANLINSLMSMCSLLMMLARYYHLKKMEELPNQQISISLALSDLNGSIRLFQLPSSWYYEW
jgi:hypothetical protein